MTAISSQPTQRFFDSWRERWNDDGNFDESMAQPYEAFVHEGMKGKTPSDDALEWENPNKYHDHEERDGVKPFDLRGKKGHWFAPASNYHDFVANKKRFYDMYPHLKPQEEGGFDPDAEAEHLRRIMTSRDVAIRDAWTVLKQGPYDREGRYLEHQDINICPEAKAFLQREMTEGPQFRDKDPNFCNNCDFCYGK
jgi:hypothetical protein